MAIRNYLHRKHLNALKKWLGNRAMNPAGSFEVIRWKNKPGKPMCIIFDKGSPEHLSCNEASLYDVRKFLKWYKNEIKI